LIALDEKTTKTTNDCSRKSSLLKRTQV